MLLNKFYSYVHEKRKGGKPKKTQEQLNAKGGKFSFDELHGFKLKQVDWVVPDMKTRKRKRRAFDNVRKEFLAEIGRTHEKELRDLGMSEKQIEKVKMGSVPVGFNVHHKLPIHGGGQNEFSNLILMPIPQHDDLHHKVLDPQVANMQSGDSKKVMLPWSDDMVFIDPARKKSNEKQDKSTEMPMPKMQMSLAQMLNHVKTAFR